MGIIRRWMVLGDEEAIAWEMNWRMEANGFPAVGETVVKLMAPGIGGERRLVKSKL